MLENKGLLRKEELVEKCMPTLERFEEVEKQIFFPIPKPVEFSATIRIYASTMSRESVRNTLATIREVVEGAGFTLNRGGILSDVEVDYYNNGATAQLQAILKALGNL